MKIYKQNIIPKNMKNTFCLLGCLLLFTNSFCTNFSLNSSGTSALYWPFPNSTYVNDTSGTNNWAVTCGSACDEHFGGDYYANNWGMSSESSSAQYFHSPISGTVIFAGRGGEVDFDYQVVVQSSQDENFAFRVANLHNVLVSVGHSVLVGQRLGYTLVNNDNTTNHEVHCVLYKNLNQYYGSKPGIERLQRGFGFGFSGEANQFAAPYQFSARANGQLPSPTEIKATDGVYQNCVKVSWDAVPDATHYQVYRGNSNDTSTMELIRNWIVATSFNDHPPITTSSETYYYSIKAASNSLGENASNYSNPDSGYMDHYINGTTLSEPIGVYASKGMYNLSGRVKVQWVSVPHATHYQVYRDTKPNITYPYTNPTLIRNWHSDSHFYDDTATPGLTYYYFIKAKNSSKNTYSGYSNHASGYVPIHSPYSLTATTDPNATQIWVRCQPKKPSYYRIYRGTSSDMSDAIPVTYWVYYNSQYNASWTDNTANPHQRYYYAARGSIYSNGTNFTDFGKIDMGHKGELPPLVPTNITATDGTREDGVAITWNTPDNETYFNVYRSEENNIDSMVSISNWQSGTNFKDTTGIPGKIYYYTLKISNHASGQHPSEFGNIEEGWERLKSPTNLSVSTDAQEGIVLTWDRVEGANGYIIYRSEENDLSTAMFIQGWETALAYTDTTNLEFGKTYYYWVKAGISPALRHSNATESVEGYAQAPNISLNLKAFLEGAYDIVEETMTTTLVDKQLIPTTQPFGVAPYCYEGTETLTTLPSEMVDWVLVEVVKTDGTILTQKAAILLANGNIVSSIDTNQTIALGTISTIENYKIIVRHRNHMDVITPNTIQIADNQLSYDFTANTNNDAKLKEVHPNIFALYAGDANTDALISTQDLNIYQQNASLLGKYHVADLNLDGNMTTKDLNLYKSNASTIGASELKLDGNCD